MFLFNDPNSTKILATEANSVNFVSFPKELHFNHIGKRAVVQAIQRNTKTSGNEIKH